MFRRKVHKYSEVHKYQATEEAKTSPEESNSIFWRVDFSEVLDLWDSGEILKKWTYLSGT